ncbi:hypothetical protein DFH06DRAFT_1333122 [Mycena polygramma]|nr:hypothetical protein DFH06DRAFT_1333122 [Mycena polygramma]
MGDLNSKDSSAHLQYIQVLETTIGGFCKRCSPPVGLPLDRLQLASIAPWAKIYGFDLHLVRVVSTKSRIIHSYYASGLSRYLIRCANDSYDDFMDEFDDADDFDANDIEMPDDNPRDDGEGEKYIDFASVIALDGFPMRFSGSIFRSQDDYEGSIFLNGEPEAGEREAHVTPLSVDVNSLIVTHTRTAILITVAEDTKARIVAGDCIDFARKALATSHSKSPTKKENRLAAILLERSTSDTWGCNKSFTALRNAAERWSNVTLFVQICKGCPNGRFISTLEVDGLVSAYIKFGWNQVKLIYAEHIPKESSRTLRAQATARLLEAAKFKKDSVAVCWFEKERQLMLDGVQNLDRYQRQLTLVVSWIRKSKAANCFRKLSISRFVSRLNASEPRPSLKYWASLFDHLHSNGGQMPAAKSAGLMKTIQATISNEARTASPFPCSTDWRGECAAVDPVFSLIEIAVRFQAFDSLAIIFSSMQRSKEQHTSQHPRAPASEYYKALALKLGPLISGQHALGKHFVPFFDQALGILLPTTEDSPELFKAIIEYSAKPLQTAKLVCAPDRVNELVKSKIKYGCLRSFAEFFAFSPRLRQDASSETLSALQNLTERCFIGMVSSMDSKSEPFRYRSPESIALDNIRFAFDARMSHLGVLVLTHLLKSPKASKPTFVSSVLAGVLRALPALLAEHKLSIAEEPYRGFAVETMMKFVRLALGPKPVASVSLDDLKAIGCGCQFCRRHLVKFFGGVWCVENVQEKQTTRTHLEKQLVEAKAAQWGVTWETIRVGRPHSLQIKKPEGLAAAGKWIESQKAATALLGVFGDVEQQTSILGPDFAWVTGVIAGTSSPERPPLAVKNTDGKVGTKRTSDAAKGAAPKSPGFRDSESNERSIPYLLG